jgi:hypothetical protein
MRVAIVVFATALLIAALAGTALAYDYPMWETYGQVPPDRVLAERTSGGELTPAYAPYSTDIPFAYGTVCSQCSPDRAIAERTDAGYEAAVAYAPYSEAEHYPFGATYGQISPDRVAEERVESGIEF